MKIHFLSTLVLQLCLTTVIVQSCVFQIVKNTNKIPKITKPHKKYTRKIYSNNPTSNSKDNCVCGKLTDYKEKPWDVLIHIQKGKVAANLCKAVIIAHNLLLSSHKCLTLNGQIFPPFDSWNPPPKYRQSTAGNLRILTHLKEPLNATDVILNPNFIDSGFSTEVASAEDLAIIVVNGSLFMDMEKNDGNGTSFFEQRYFPVCLPTNDGSKNWSKEILHRYAFHYGIGGKYSGDETVENRLVNELVILDGKECDEEQGIEGFSTSGTLCVRTVVPLPTIEGGPLLTTDVNGHFLFSGFDKSNGFPLPSNKTQTAFLVGLSTVTQLRPPGQQIRYTYFGNVLEQINAIEEVADKYGSEWCETPALPETPKAKGDELKLKKWPWESGQDKRKRSETLDCACGWKNSVKKGRVVGGEDAIPYEFGWMVKMLTGWVPNDPDFQKSKYRCGASIINDRVVLTAAHCLSEYWDTSNANGIPQELPNKVALFLGSHSILNTNEEINVTVKVKNIFPHPGYLATTNNDVFGYDIAVIILEEPIKFASATTQKQVTDHDIRPACLPKIDDKIELQEKTDIIAMGWGILNPWGPNKTYSPQVLQKIQVPILDIRKCVDRAGEVIPDTLFCVGNFTEKYGVSQGDSGGPLLFQKTDGSDADKFFQVGVVSFAIFLEDDKSKWIGFITDVQQFIPFIEYYSDLYGAKWCKK